MCKVNSVYICIVKSKIVFKAGNFKPGRKTLCLQFCKTFSEKWQENSEKMLLFSTIENPIQTPIKIKVIHTKSIFFSKYIKKIML